MATYTKTITSSSYVWPVSSFSSAICEGRITDQIVDDFGVNVKIRAVTTTSYNDYGDPTESYTDTYSKAYIHRWTATDDEVKEGIFKNGQIMFVFKNSDEAKIKPGNKIFYKNNWYRITQTLPQVMAEVTYLIDAIVEISN